VENCGRFDGGFDVPFTGYQGFRRRVHDGCASGRGVRFSKNSLYSSTLQGFVRNRWNYEHNLAFLLDSQAKFP
jgi:hypothetical protein